MRKLTVELIDCSEVSMVDGGELNFADSGEVLRKGTVVSRRLRTNWPNSLGQDAFLVEPDLWS
jgi:hypothetical protein